MATPPKPPVKPHLLEARKQRAIQLLGQQLDAEREAAVIEALIPVEGHPASPSNLERAQGRVRDRKAELQSVAKAAGVSVADLLSTVRAQRKDGLADQIEQWQQARDLHEDMATNPAAYGGVDLGGAPIDVAQQQRFVLELDAALAAARAELETLRTT